jgi:Mn-dependent DtxR family transcriptional regulator
MKILRKGNDFKKMAEKSVQDVLLVRNLLNQGWKYCSKQEYREAQGIEKAVKEVIEDETPEKITKASKKKSKNY